MAPGEMVPTTRNHLGRLGRENERPHAVRPTVDRVWPVLVGSSSVSVASEPDLGASKPGRDPSVGSVVQRVEVAATVDARLDHDQEPGFDQQPKLPAGCGPAQADRRGDGGRASRSNGDEGHDLAVCRIGKQGNPRNMRVGMAAS